MKKHGTASADPYVLGAELGNGSQWLFGTSMGTFGGLSGTGTSKRFTNLYANEVYRISYNPPGVASEVALETVGGEEIYSSRVEADQIRTLTVSGLNSDAYIVRYKFDKTPPAGAAIMTKVERLPDSDGDGDPDETDPYPNDPARNSNSGKNNSGSGSGMSKEDEDKKAAECANKPYINDKSDPQFDVYDQVAQKSLCMYQATGKTEYLDYGNQNCAVLNDLMKTSNNGSGYGADGKGGLSWSNGFKPKYCSGGKMIR